MIAYVNDAMCLHVPGIVFSVCDPNIYRIRDS
jgi:hypothetical protein